MSRTRATDPATAGGREAAAGADPVVREASARLRAEFARSLRGDTVESVVRRSRAELSGVPDGAAPELVERLARQYLLKVGPHRPRHRTPAREPDRQEGTRSCAPTPTALPS